MAVAFWVRHPEFSVPNAVGAFCLRQGSIYADSIVGKDKTTRFSDRFGLYFVPQNLSSARIAFKTTGGKVRAECTQFGSIKGKLKALPAPFEHEFIAAPFSEQGGKNQGQHFACQDDGLRS
jgi:hypothetical protein